MIYGALWVLTTAFDDGAGNKATYVYTISGVTLTESALRIWKLHNFCISTGALAKTFTAVSRTVVLGAPPAANTRTLTITPQRLCTFADTDEVLFTFSATLALTVVEDHPYTDLKLVIHPNQEFASFTTTISGGAPDNVTQMLVPIEYDTPQLLVTGDSAAIVGEVAATAIASGILPVFDFYLVDRELLERPFPLSFTQTAVKFGLAALPAFKGRYEGIAAALTNYMINPSQFMGVSAPMKTVRAFVGVITI